MTAGNARAGQVSLPAHDRRNGAGIVAALVAIVRNAERHQQRAQVGEAQTERPVVVRVARDLFGRIAGVVDNDLLRHDQGVHRVAESLYVELPVRSHEFHQVQRRQVAGRIVQEHVLRAGVRGVDARRVLAGVPAVHGGVELHAGIAALVRGFGDFVHQVARLVTILGLAADHGLGPPVAVLGDGFHELIGHAHGIVGVLEKDRAVGLAIERGIVAGFHQRVGLLLFFRFAPDEALDIGMVAIEDHHLGSTTRLPAGFDNAGECVEALHKRERPGGAAAARQNGILFAQRGQVRAGARAPFEQHAFRLGQI